MCVYVYPTLPPREKLITRSFTKKKKKTQLKAESSPPISCNVIARLPNQLLIFSKCLDTLLMYVKSFDIFTDTKKQTNCYIGNDSDKSPVSLTNKYTPSICI